MKCLSFTFLPFCQILNDEELINVQCRNGNLTYIESAIELFGKEAVFGAKKDVGDFGEGFSCLQMAVESKNVTLVRELIKLGAYVNENSPAGFAALHKATNQSGSHDVAQPLINVGARDAAVGTPLQYARQHERLEVAQLL